MSSGGCTYCGRAIDVDRDYRRVTGWERKRDQGGTNAIRVRQPEDVWACWLCVDKLAMGITPDQTELAL